MFKPKHVERYKLNIVNAHVTDCTFCLSYVTSLLSPKPLNKLHCECHKFHTRTGHEEPEGELYPSFNLGARCGRMVNATPRQFYPRKRAGTPCIGGWVVPKAGLDGFGKPLPRRDSIPGPSSSTTLVPDTVGIVYRLVTSGFKQNAYNFLSAQQAYSLKDAEFLLSLCNDRKHSTTQRFSPPLRGSARGMAFLRQKAVW